MATKEYKELSQAKYYASRRLSEIKQDLLRLGIENTELKAQLETPTEDEKALAEIRRQRSYIWTRSAKLKEERKGLEVDLATARAELEALQIERRKAEEEVSSAPTEEGAMA